MLKRLSAAARILIPVVLAILLLYYAFGNVEFSEFLEKSRHANYWWVIASIILSLFGYILRAFRWNLLLKPLGYRVTTYRSTLSVLIMYLANLAFPRLGEVTRCAILKKTDNVPVTISLGSVISERLIDALTLFSLIGFAFVLEFDLISTFMTNILSEYQIDSQKIIYGLVGLLVIGVVVLVILFSSENALTKRLKFLLRGIYEGLSSIRKVNSISLFVISSFLLWLVYYLMAYIIVFSLEETAFLSISAGFMLLVTGGIALALPVQGGIGTYHTMVTAMLMLYGIDNTTGLFLATLLHTSQIVAIAIFGGVAVLLSLLISRRRKYASDQIENKNVQER